MFRSQSPSRRQVLELVRRGRAPTRRRLADLTGLSRSVVAQLVADLVAEGLVVEHVVEQVADTTVHRGRPSIQLRVAAQPGYVSALDLGHRHIRAAISDLDRRVLLERRIDFCVDDSSEAALRRARHLVAEQLHAVGAGWHELRAVGVALPFPVVRGVVHPFGRIAGWDQVRPAAALRMPAGVPVVVVNDADAGAWSELVDAADPAHDSVLYAKVGDGIGAGLVVNGSIVSGAHGAGGEIGHVVVAECRLRCRCGRVGCLDALVSAADRPGALPGELHAAGQAVGRTLAQLASLVDPDVVVVGGELGNREGSFTAAARAAYAEHAVSCGPARLTAARRGLRAELWGALEQATEAAWSALSPGVGRIPAVN